MFWFSMLIIKIVNYEVKEGLPAMELNMSADDVLNQISALISSGESLSKKNVKKAHPDLMKSALYYYPSWDHALEKSGLTLQ